MFSDWFIDFFPVKLAACLEPPSRANYRIFLAVWASSCCPLLGRTRSGEGVEQPFDCLIVQNHQAVQSMGWSIDWTLEDSVVDGLFFCATLTGHRGSHTPFGQTGAKRPTSLRGRLSRTQSLLGRVIPGWWVPVLGMKVRSLVMLSNHSALHWWSAQCAELLLLLSDNWWDAVRRVQIRSAPPFEICAPISCLAPSCCIIQHCVQKMNPLLVDFDSPLLRNPGDEPSTNGCLDLRRSAFPLGGQMSAEWSRCPGSIARCARESVGPLRSSAGWMPARIWRLSAGVGRRHPVTIRKASLMARSRRRVWALRHQPGAQYSVVGWTRAKVAVRNVVSTASRLRSATRDVNFLRSDSRCRRHLSDLSNVTPRYSIWVRSRKAGFCCGWVLTHV